MGGPLIPTRRASRRNTVKRPQESKRKGDETNETRTGRIGSSNRSEPKSGADQRLAHSQSGGDSQPRRKRGARGSQYCWSLSAEEQPEDGSPSFRGGPPQLTDL